LGKKDKELVCPVCNGESFSLWEKIGQYAVETCTTCDLGITFPRPSTNEIYATNQEIYQVENRIKTYFARNNYFRKRYRRYLANMKLYQHGGRLLDIGCNLGFFLNVAREEGFSVAGVELNRDCAEYARNIFHIEVFSDLLERVALPSHGFDVVTLFDVLEHVPDIQTFLAEVGRILKPGGLLVVQSPNIRSVMATLTKGNWVWLSLPDHIYHFSPGSLSRFIESHGFTIKKLRTWEPAKDFADNLITAHISHPMIRRLMLTGNDLTRFLLLPAWLFQRLWWQRQRGALIEVYAIKTDKGG
jgi:2-polyprenyl-3-methyl-5-hydroxy-6-metoxy-1,4-benzoquinol methylase